MATRVRQEPLFITILLLTLWPLKVVVVYFTGCVTDIKKSLLNEWRDRERYTGWDR